MRSIDFSSHQLIDLPVLIVDAQTTGATPERGRLLELAWRLSADGETQSAILLGKDGTRADVPARIAKLVGIADDEWADAKTEDEMFADLSRAVSAFQSGVAVAHFASFEARFLEDLWQRRTGEAFPLPLICTHAISRRLFPELPSRSLRAVAGFFGAPVATLKRASCHVDATALIWRRLCTELSTRVGINTVEDLRSWLEQKAKVHRGPRAYQMDRALRLSLPDLPGVYKMLGCDGRVLYVGKATSLKSRVNSYFRQRRGHSSPKLELLTQAVGLETVTCESALEAALLESDEIKRLAPPYNVALRQDDRSLAFFDRALNPVPACEAVYGPFPSARSLEGLRALARVLEEESVLEEVASALFYGEVELGVLQEGFALFRAQQPVSGFGTSLRSLMARGWWMLRRARAAAALAGELEAALEKEDEDEETPEVGDDDEAPTAESVAKHLDWVLLSSAAAFERARLIAPMLDCRVAWRGLGERLWRYLRFADGTLVAAAWSEDGAPPDLSYGASSPRPALSGYGAIDVPTYDRMRVLTSELARMASSGTEVRLYARRGEVAHGMDSKLSAARRRTAADHGANPEGVSP